MTYLNLINAVLRKLRETEVTSVSESSYSRLIGALVNEAKDEVEDAWDWSHLRQDVSVNTMASTSRYVVTGLGDRYDIIQALNITRDSVMQRVPYSYIKRSLLTGTSTEGSPMYYNMNGVSSGNPYMDVFPVPSGVETITFNAVVRQATLATDNAELLIPSNPVVLGAYYRAIKERGEDSGDGSVQAEKEYRRVWSAAVARDVAKQEEETTWQVV